MDKKIIKDLLNRYLAGNASPAEKKLVEDWLDENDVPGNEWNDMPEEQRLTWMSSLQYNILKSIDRSQPANDTKKIIILPWYRRLYIQLAAAVIIILVVGSWYLTLRDSNALQKETVAVNKIKADTLITPGTNKAVLTLADGGTLALNDADNGIVTTQGNTQAAAVCHFAGR